MNRKYLTSLFLFAVILIFSNCEQNNKQQSKNYLEEGMKIALATKQVLGKNLVSAIQEKGTYGALSFCNEKAIPLTDSMAITLGAKIKRVSDKNRNDDNLANEKELAYILQAKATILNAELPAPMLQEINQQMVGYYPIMSNGMCLQCHGDKKKNIDEKTMAVIRKEYPEDKATGYLANELRGIWVVSMDK